MKKLIKVLPLISVISCSHQYSIWRTPASSIGQSCQTSMSALIKNREEVLPLVESKHSIGRDTSLVTIFKGSDELPEKEVEEFKQIIHDVNLKLVKGTRDLVPAEEVYLLLQKRGDRAYFQPIGGRLVATTRQYSTKSFSYFSTPWSKKFKDAESIEEISYKSKRPRDKAHYILKWASNNLKDHQRGEVRLYTKNPSYSRSILAHEYGHSIVNTNMRRKNKDFRDFFAARERLTILASDKTMDEYKVKYEAMLKKLKKDHPELSDEEIDNLPEVVKFEEEIKKFHKDQMAKIKEVQEFMESLKFNSDMYKQFNSYNELFADVSAVLFSNGDPKAISDALIFSKQLQTYKKINNDPLNLLSRDFSNKGNRIDNWIEEDQVHASMAPTRYFLYQRFLQKPYYQSGKGASELYQKVFDIMLDETNFRMNNPEVDLSWKEWNIRFMDKLEKSTKDWK